MTASRTTRTVRKLTMIGPPNWILPCRVVDVSETSTGRPPMLVAERFSSMTAPLWIAAGLRCPWGTTRSIDQRSCRVPVLLHRMESAGHLRVRAAVLDDLPGLLEVYEGTRATEPSERERQTWHTMLATGNLSVYCAEVNGQVVGTAMLLTMPNLTYACQPTAFIEAVIVHTQWRRQGIATAMLERLIDDARLAGCNKVQLLSHKRHADDGAHDLYEKLDFEAEADGFRRYLTTVPTKVMAARNRS